jgi:hypothetical protein
LETAAKLSVLVQYGIFAGLAEGRHTGPAHVWFQYLFT